MKHTTSIFVDAPPDASAAILADLGTYPEWNDVVQAAVPDGSAAWITTLRARVGPFARSKQLRLVRIVNEAEGDGPHRIRFERDEVDGRDHADWIMEATIADEGKGARVELGLEYQGGLWTGALDPVLGAAIERATRRLPDYVNGQP